MTTGQFSDWFNSDFVTSLLKRNLKPCFAYSDPEELASGNGAIYTKFLQAKFITLIQVLDQGVILSVKRLQRSRRFKYIHPAIDDWTLDNFYILFEKMPIENEDIGKWLKYIHTEKVINSYNEVHTYSIVITLHAYGLWNMLHTDPV